MFDFDIILPAYVLWFDKHFNSKHFAKPPFPNNLPFIYFFILIVFFSVDILFLYNLFKNYEFFRRNGTIIIKFI